MVEGATETPEAEVEHPGQQARPAERDSGRVRAELYAARLKWRRKPGYRVETRDVLVLPDLNGRLQKPNDPSNLGRDGTV